MADDKRYETVPPYAVSAGDDPAGGGGEWRGRVKARIRIPLDMPVPREILGVVLTPEVSRSAREGGKYDVSGWIDAMIYYQPYPSDDPTEPGVREVGPEDAFTAPPSRGRSGTSFDDYFLDLDRDDGQGVMEIEGVEKHLEEDEKWKTSCLTSRVPFGLYFNNEGFDEEIRFSPQIHSVECLIRGARLIDLEVDVDLLSPELEPAARSEVDEYAAETALSAGEPGEPAIEDVLPEEPGEIEMEAALTDGSGMVEDQILEEPWEPKELLKSGEEVIEGVELINEFEYPVLGLGYSFQSSPRRPSRGRRIEGAAEGSAVKPRSLARLSGPEAGGPQDGVPGADDSRSRPRSGRRQSATMRFRFDG
ncbi:MAG: hypothetical protein HPY50_06705 [Firmicutes bacterium]|nr:hypothetical protein [Bacillota bacterium]